MEISIFYRHIEACVSNKVVYEHEFQHRVLLSSLYCNSWFLIFLCELVGVNYKAYVPFSVVCFQPPDICFRKLWQSEKHALLIATDISLPKYYKSFVWMGMKVYMVEVVMIWKWMWWFSSIVRCDEILCHTFTLSQSTLNVDVKYYLNIIYILEIVLYLVC